MSTLNLSSWKSVGASIVGPSHIVMAKANQDAWAAFHHIWGHGITVSDGLGSKPLSNHGSVAACRAVELAARRFVTTKATGARANLLSGILQAWLHSIAPLDPRDSSATCLFALCLGDGLIRVGMLGDGCAVVIKRDGGIISLIDDKGSLFSNQTNALKASVEEGQWKIKTVADNECDAVILCTDGVSDDLQDLEGFMRGFVKQFRGLSRVTASRQVRQVLESWPVPKHSDDKTIACLFRSEACDE